MASTLVLSQTFCSRENGPQGALEPIWCGNKSGSTNRSSKEVWKTGWVQDRDFGRTRRYTSDPMGRSTSNGPRRLKSSLFKGQAVRMFLRNNQTQLPASYMGRPRVRWSMYLCWNSFALSRLSQRVSWTVMRELRSWSATGTSDLLLNILVRGWNKYCTKNGEKPVEEETEELKNYSAKGRSVTQSSCLSKTKFQR